MSTLPAVLGVWLWAGQSRQVARETQVAAMKREKSRRGGLSAEVRSLVLASQGSRGEVREVRLGWGQTTDTQTGGTQTNN